MRCKMSGRKQVLVFSLSLPEDPRKSLSSIPWNNASNHVFGCTKCGNIVAPCTSGHLNGKFDSVWDGKIVNCGMTHVRFDFSGD